ncbi:MAG: DUF1707 SHOCT-like domain-containing protein [Streptosporangiales bacterium]
MTTDPELQPGGESAPAVRASDADRNHAADVLRDAAGDGRLDFDELGERLEQVYAAKTHAELAPILADLATVERSSRVDVEPLVLETRGGTVKQNGYWMVPRHITARSRSGNVTIDFTEADCAHSEVLVEAGTRSGNVTIILPRGWAVRIEAAQAGMGNVKNKATDPPLPGKPLVRVRGTVRSGNIKVRYPRGRRR